MKKMMRLVWMCGVLTLIVGGQRLGAQATKDGVSLYAEGSYEAAVEVFRKELAEAEHDYGAESGECLRVRNNLANALNALGCGAEAEGEHRKVLVVRERVLGREHVDTLSSRSNLAVALQAQGKDAAAEKEYREVLRGRVGVVGVDERDVLKTFFGLALCVESQGRLADALVFARLAEEGWAKQLGANDAITLRAKAARMRIEGAGNARQ